MIRPLSGVLRPAFVTEHSGWADELQAVEQVAARIGLTLMPWQADAIAVATQHEDGRYLYPVVVVSVPRQCGKSTILKAVAFQRLTSGGLLGRWEAALLAQTRQDAARFIVDWAEHGADLELTAYRGVGSERLHGPFAYNQLRAYAASATSMHSRSLDALVWDETWSVDAELGRAIMQAAVPAMATRSDRQTWIVSTAGTRESVFLREWIERARNGEHGVCLIEYAAPAGTSLDDLRDWPTWHPAFGLTQDEAGIRDARRLQFKGDDAGFRRAFLNQWPDAIGAIGAIDPKAWASSQTEAPDLPEAGTAVLAFDVDPHALSSSIAAAWWDADQARARIELVDHRPGVGWLLPRLRDVMADHGVRETWSQDFGPVAATLDQVKRDKIPVQTIGGRETAAAVQAFLSAVHDGGIAHHGQQALSASALAIGTRPFGDGVQWARRDQGITSPITAASWALWGLQRHKLRRRPRIIVASG